MDEQGNRKRNGILKMNQKVLKTLEYYKIIEQLEAYASCEDTKKRTARKKNRAIK